MDVLMGNKYICECCGGKINRATMTCEYCGTQYKEDPHRDGIIRVETFRNPIHTYVKLAKIPKEEIMRMSDSMGVEAATRHVTDCVMREMARQFAECIMQDMSMEYRNDTFSNQYIARGTIKVVSPEQDSTYPTFDDYSRIW